MKALEGFLEDIEARKKILQQIIARPRTGDRNRLDWSGAFADHPEWRTQLGWDSPTHQGRAYALANAMQKHKTMNGQRAVLLANPPKKAIHRSLLAPEESNAIVQFIRANRKNYPSKAACFTAALEAAGAVGKLINNAGAVARYFAKAAKASKAATLAGGNGSVKRHVKPQQPVQPVAQKTINFCSNCGQSIKAQALGAVLAERILAGAVITINGEPVEYAS